jgi:hypothetical protein
MRCWSVFGKEMGHRLRSYVLCKVSKIYQFEKGDPTRTIVHSMSSDIHDQQDERLSDLDRVHRH